MRVPKMDGPAVVCGQFCVMTPDGPHPAYGAKESYADALAAMEFDGGPDLHVAHRTVVITATRWERAHDPSSDAEPGERS